MKKVVSCVTLARIDKAVGSQKGKAKEKESSKVTASTVAKWVTVPMTAGVLK